MDTRDLETAVRLVLPAVNLDPLGFALDPGFLTRAERSDKYLGLAVDSMACQFVFAGFRPDCETAQVDRVAADALASLQTATLAVCESLVVAWAGSGANVLAAAFAVLPSGKLGKLIGCSWSDPETWPEPMIDASKSGDELIKGGLARLESVIRDRTDKRESTFAADLKRALRIVEISLLRYGGEGQDTSAHPSIFLSEEDWDAWLTRYTRSVRDEWRRVCRGVVEERSSERMEPPENGPLAGLRVFLSYARPDATALAWPVYEVLRSCGADVWFDQERGPDQDQLAAGFAETIGRCDVYIMCATDEFVERAGYATQELAWAMQQRASGRTTRYFLVVTWPGTILPTAIADWPAIELRRGAPEELKRELLARLQPSSAVIRSGSTAVPPVLAPPAAISPLLVEADLPYERRRAQHVLRFDEIDQTTIERLLSSEDDDRHSMGVRQRLLDVGEGLDWDGTLQDLDLWPDDPLVLDTRFRLAAVRAVVGTRWPLNGDFGWEPGIAPDVERLATERVPVISWPSVAGWDDSARRFALRHHAGLLRVLSELLRRGLTGGITDIPESTIRLWSDELVTRRRECADAVLVLRLGARITWQRDPPEWDALFRFWRKFLLKPGCAWPEPAPPAVLQILVANVLEIAAVAAETGWYAARYGGLARQTFVLKSGTDLQPVVEVYAGAIEGVDSPGTGENTVGLGLVAQLDGGATLRLSWNGRQFSQTSASGSVSMPAPDQLDRAINFLRT